MTLLDFLKTVNFNHTSVVIEINGSRYSNEPDLFVGETLKSLLAIPGEIKVQPVRKLDFKLNPDQGLDPAFINIQVYLEEQAE